MIELHTFRCHWLCFFRMYLSKLAIWRCKAKHRPRKRIRSSLRRIRHSSISRCRKSSWSRCLHAARCDLISSPAPSRFGESECGAGKHKLSLSRNIHKGMCSALTRHNAPEAVYLSQTIKKNFPSETWDRFSVVDMRTIWARACSSIKSRCVECEYFIRNSCTFAQTIGDQYLHWKCNRWNAIHRIESNVIQTKPIRRMMAFVPNSFRVHNVSEFLFR